MFVDFTKLVGMWGDGKLWSYEVDMVEDSGGWTDREVQMERCGQLSNSNQNVGLETVPGDTNITHPDYLYSMKANSVTLTSYSEMAQGHWNEDYRLGYVYYTSSVSTGSDRLILWI